MGPPRFMAYPHAFEPNMSKMSNSTENCYLKIRSEVVIPGDFLDVVHFEK